MGLLAHARQRGQLAALQKLALSPPTQVDQFMADIEHGKDMPPSPETDVPGGAPGIQGENPGMPLPQDPAAALGNPTGALPMKGAALGLKDMLFFEKMLGPDDARNMFQSIDRQMAGGGRGRSGTLQIGPQGVQVRERALPPPTPGLAGSGGLGHAAAEHVMTSAPRIPKR